MAQKSVIDGTIAQDMTDANDNFTELYAYATEITTARDGEETLTAKIQAVEATVTTVTTEVTNARDGEANLLAQIDSLQADIATNTAEIEAARGGEVDLDTRLDGFDTDIASLTNAELPGQTGNAGAVLTTDATNASWASPATLNLCVTTDNLSELANADTALTNLGGTATGTAVFKAASAAAARAAIGADGLASVQVFTTSGTWTRPSSVRVVKIWVTGAGANKATADHRSGASGGTAMKILDVSSISTSTITVGANGGSGGASSWADGTNTITGNGGTGSGETATGGTATGGDINLLGTPGSSGYYTDVDDQARSGGTPSYWGGGYGAGGGADDANGKDGVVIVEEYK